MDGDLGSVLDKFKDYFSRYDQFVRLNPRLAAEIEAIIRWSSYLVATRKSPILGELLSSGANLLQLCNDIILRQANTQLSLELKNVSTQLKTFLSVIQSLELFAEIYARETYGNAGRWAIITAIQIAKAAIKLVLLLVFEEGITKTQAIVPLDRIHYAEIIKLQEKFGSSVAEDVQHELEPQPQPSSSSKSIVLKSSGRKMRSIKDSPPKGTRFSKDPNESADGPLSNLQRQRLLMLIDRYRQHRSEKLTERQLYGELLHITRPLVHLTLMGSLGTQSWLSYFTSLAMDVSSLYLVKSPLPLVGSSVTSPELMPLLGGPRPTHKFNANERLELGQRAASLLLYLLRSPFFDEYTKQRALEGLSSTAQNIPLLGGFLSTFVNYIPEWQKDYFRVWSD